LKKTKRSLKTLITVDKKIENIESSEKSCGNCVPMFIKMCEDMSVNMSVTMSANMSVNMCVQTFV
jgi:hypothetical protein